MQIPHLNPQGCFCQVPNVPWTDFFKKRGWRGFRKRCGWWSRSSFQNTKSSFKFKIIFLATYLSFFGLKSYWVWSFFQVVVSEIRSRAMEAKTRRKASFSMDSFNWIIFPSTGELFTAPNAMQKNEDSDHEEKEDFFSVGSCLSRCSTVRSVEEFFSVKTQFSRCSSLSRLDCRDFRTFVVQEFWHGIDYQELLRRRSIIQEFCHCKGWPFGLCRKALLLPPLPKSPSESWSWRKGVRLVKLPWWNDVFL